MRRETRSTRVDLKVPLYGSSNSPNVDTPISHPWVVSDAPPPSSFPMFVPLSQSGFSLTPFLGVDLGVSWRCQQHAPHLRHAQDRHLSTVVKPLQLTTTLTTGRNNN